MRYYNLDTRTQLLLRARALNGVKMVVSDEDEKRVMGEMVRQGLFRYSEAMFSEGYWWTSAGERAAEETWQRIPVQPINTRYRGHPQVRMTVNGYKEEVCHVFGLSVRESFDSWLVDHPNGEKVVSFASADDAIAWVLAGRPLS